MENIKLRKHTHSCISNNNSHPSLAIHKDSHALSKTTKPKIRIIHIFAPEIIKTDAENFRELVQKLTGKPSEEINMCHNKKKKKKTRVIPKTEEILESRSSSSTTSGMSSEDQRVLIAKKTHEVRNDKTNNNYYYNSHGGFWGLDVTTRDHRVKQEVGICSSDESSGGYLCGFSDLEGFISEIAEFPLLPLDATPLMQGFEEPQLL
ncbi:hypothetical protein RJT34_23862 [Clitoria ternatea]|uniref:VQ domain-containing protein n=1 Tax=Clitoria ternatea TaxID=43366 RepID=A0AAN9FNH8_CLITE